VADLVAVGVRDPHHADLSGVVDLLERFDDVRVVAVRVWAVVLVERDLVDAEPLATTR